MKRDFGQEHLGLQPIVPHHEDERLKIPEEKASEHPAIADQKAKAEAQLRAEEERKRKEAEPKPVYGESYERRHKDTKRDVKPIGRGITSRLEPDAPKPTTELGKPKTTPEVKTAPATPK